ncbi:MAG: glycosyltransferase [Cyanobacteria bacterium RI_101]|nr:glycosyltransferase [Cyanobacteria bacterium RI_101]
MRKLYFLLPGLGGKFRCGGLFAELKAFKLTQEVCPAEVVTYRQREPETLFLTDLLAQGVPENCAFVLSWGFDVPQLARRLASYPLLYHAHSAGYGFRLPPSVPILTVSRNTLAYWGQQAPHSLLYYCPNEISPEFTNTRQRREIDVLIQARKSSRYLLTQLIPDLRRQGLKVEAVSGYVEDLAALFNQAKIYLYDSAEYWALQGVSEGFGLQPLEALACGCQVFSSLNGGLGDYLDPGFNSYKIAGYALEFDRERILAALKTPNPLLLAPEALAEYRRDNIIRRLGVILPELNRFWDALPHCQTLLAPLTPRRLWGLKLAALGAKIRQKLGG